MPTQSKKGTSFPGDLKSSGSSVSSVSYDCRNKNRAARDQSKFFRRGGRSLAALPATVQITGEEGNKFFEGPEQLMTYTQRVK